MSHRRLPLAAGAPAARRLRAWLAVVFIALLGTVSPATHARESAALVIRSAQATLGDGVYELDAALDLQLPDDARRAIEGGLTLRLTYEVVLNRVRRYMPDADVASVAQTNELSYHALSQRYLVRNLNTGEQADFGTLEAALTRITELRNLPVLDAGLIEDGPSYEGRVRAVLALSTVPEAFGWLVFWADDWSGNSEWYSWSLHP
jgi:hypothetical protein